MFAALLEKIVFARIKALLIKKAVAAGGSATIGVLAMLTAAALWLQQNPEVAAAVVGGKWGPVVISVCGVAVAVARARSL